MKNSLYFMEKAIKEALKADKKNNIPVGAIIVQNNQIIAKAHNQEFWHAEILCIMKAQKKNCKYLENSVLFSTLEPCPMCEHAAKLSKIKQIIFGAENDSITKKNENYKIKIETKKCSKILKNSFKKKR